MRKLFLAALIVATVFITACKTRAQKLEGEWKVKEYSITNIDDAIKKQLEGTPDSLMEERKKMVNDNINKFTAESKKETYTFRTDSFDAYRGGRPDKGTWKISSDGTMLFLMSGENPKPQADVYDVETIGAKELKFKFKLTPDNIAIYILEKK